MHANDRRVVLVVIDARPGDPRAPSLDGLPVADVVVCADSGADLALRLGLSVDVLVGDLDSISERSLAAVERSGAIVERHHADKDQTDLELALDVAMRHQPDDLIVIGGAGGRLDHGYANLLALTNPAITVRVHARLGGAKVTPVTERADITISGQVGDLVSLLPVGDVRGVRTSGLRWPLSGDDLAASSARGLSNVMLHPTATVAVDGGSLLVIQPAS